MQNPDQPRITGTTINYLYGLPTEALVLSEPHRNGTHLGSRFHGATAARRELHS